MTAMAGRTALRWGGATHVGRVRTVNEDNYIARDDVGLWAVTDGMGGHRGGEVASEIACEALGRTFADRTVDGLIEAIEQANEAVYRTGNTDPDLSGMGTTVVALAVVDEDGDEVLAVANVGDSRIYRYSVGEFEQLTDDHSLVADLVREGTLSPEEAAVHPQRNIVTRVLGVHDDVPVDVFAVDPYPGDRYLLCSDGLFNEVPERGIASVLRTIADPNEAAEELVHLAVDGGGRDNITVVVVDVVEDGGRAADASGALAGDALGAAPPTGPEPSPAYARDEPSWRRFRPPSDTAELDRVELDDDDLAAESRRGRRARHRAERPKARRVTWRVLLFVLLVVALVGGVIATIQWYGTSAYFVGFDGDQVAIYKGRPGGVLWIDPDLVDVTDLDRDEVPDARVADIDAGVEQGSLADARRYVANVTEQAEELAPQATTTTVPTTTTAPTTTVPPPATAAPA